MMMSRPTRSRSQAAAVTVALCASACWSATYHVAQRAPKASDQNAGTAAAPLATLGAAMQKAKPGDTISVGDGVYREEGTWPEKDWEDPAQRLTLTAAEGARPVIDGADPVPGPWEPADVKLADRAAKLAAIYACAWEPYSTMVFVDGEPLGVAIDMVRLAGIEVTSNVLILGQGPIGLMATALAKRAGARRLFVSQPARRVARVELARRFGADAVIDPTETPLREYDFGCEIDRVLVTSPPQTLPEAFDVAAKGGIVSFIGIEHGEGAFCSFDANAFHFKKLQLRASFASPALFTPLALQHLRAGLVDGEALISHRFPLARIADAMAAADAPDAVKVVVTG